jgi:serine protease Do
MQTKNSSSVKRASRVSALALSLGFTFGALTGGLAFGQQAPHPKMAERSKTTTTDGLASPVELSRVFVNVAKQVKPAVVHINVVEKPRSSVGSQPRNFPRIPGFPPFGQGEPRARRGTGSGVIISADGYILTNNHVAGDADEIKVKLADGRELRARRVGSDPETDLALIKVDERNLPFAELGESAKLEQGEWVIALGSPFGLEQTMTAGIVSATGRDLRRGAYDNFVQTDASINPGNSGGPLVNMNGEVIGINTMIYSRSGGSEGIGFAIPSDLAKKVYAQLLKNGRVSRGYLGVNLQDVTPAVAKAVGYAGKDGALVRDLTPASPAARAGLKSGDVIVQFDGRAVKSPKHLTEMVSDMPIGKAVPVKFVREGREQTASITMGERPSPTVAQNNVAPEEESDGKLGISVATVTAEMAREMKLKINSGALVERVVPNSPAAEAGLRRGDVIHRIDRTAVTTAEAATAALNSLGADQEAVLQIERGGQLMFITVTLK